jgi:hypothetical protein
METSNNMAPTIEIIKDVEAAHRLGFMSYSEATDLLWALKDGLISAPIWEDYGLHTRSDGRAEYRR